jgi:outer membrane putative beta-barrel porin/alpha-amylase
VSAKRQFGLPPGDFNLSMTAGLALPTSAEKVSGRGYDPYIQIPWSRELSEPWSLSGMFTVTWFTSEPTQNPTFEQTFAVERLLGYRGRSTFETQSGLPIGNKSASLTVTEM